MCFFLFRDVWIFEISTPKTTQFNSSPFLRGTGAAVGPTNGLPGYKKNVTPMDLAVRRTTELKNISNHIYQLHVKQKGSIFCLFNSCQTHGNSFFLKFGEWIHRSACDHQHQTNLMTPPTKNLLTQLPAPSVFYRLFASETPWVSVLAAHTSWFPLRLHRGGTKTVGVRQKVKLHQLRSDLTKVLGRPVSRVGSEKKIQFWLQEGQISFWQHNIFHNILWSYISAKKVLTITTEWRFELSLGASGLDQFMTSQHGFKTSYAHLQTCTGQDL